LSSPLQLLEEVKNSAFEELEDCSTLEQLEDFRVKHLGRKGTLREILSNMSAVPPEKRPEVGKEANQLKNRLNSTFERKEKQLKEKAREKKKKEQWLDVTLPGRGVRVGHTHPVRQVLQEIKTIFRQMGFNSEDGPEIETDWYNFEALNIPEDHPARDMHDTFYLEDGRLLRTHTSPVQIHAMENTQPPLQIIAPGKVFRRDADVTHSPMFHQVEGLWVDEKVTFSELKGTLELFVHRLFSEDTRLRFRPSYFPFTEPSAEIDIAFEPPGSSSTTWLEILGAGMVHPRVFEAVGYDTEKYQGFAFGMGVERLAMLKYGVDNLQLFFENDMRFLSQF